MQEMSSLSPRPGIRATFATEGQSPLKEYFLCIFSQFCSGPYKGQNNNNNNNTTTVLDVVIVSFLGFELM